MPYTERQRLVASLVKKVPVDTRFPQRRALTVPWVLYSMFLGLSKSQPRFNKLKAAGDLNDVVNDDCLHTAVVTIFDESNGARHVVTVKREDDE